MEALFNYLIKSVLYTATFYGVYWFFLRKETFYHFNRFFLLLGACCALLLPFYSFSYLVELQVNTLNGIALEKNVNVIASQNWLLIGLKIIFIAYLLVSCILVLKQLFGLWKIKTLINKYGYTAYQGCRLITNTDLDSSFSVGKYIFLAAPVSTSEQEKKLILAHELAHVKQHHWIDLLFLQLYCVLQWFNPFAWLYLRAIRENHEFLADREVLAKGNSSAQYRAALINHSLKVPVFVFASPFLGNSKFNRLKMMKKPNSSPIKQWRVLLVVPIVLLFLFAFAEPEYVRVVKDKNPLPTTKDKGLEITGYKTEKRTVETTIVSTEIKQDRTPVVVRRVKPKLKAINKTAELNKDIIAPMLIIDGVESNLHFTKLNSASIESVNVYKNDLALLKYGSKGRHGVIEVMMKK